MQKKKLKLNEQVHFIPFVNNGEKYDLSHLDAHKTTYTDEKKNYTYEFYITYSLHCFAKENEKLSPAENKSLMYCAEKESRPFHFERYELSKKLPELINELPSSLVFHAGHGSYATCTLENLYGEKIEYFISLVFFRENRKLRIHVQSAYPLDEKLGKKRKANFFVIAYNLLRNRPLPKPHK